MLKLTELIKCFTWTIYSAASDADEMLLSFSLQF